LPAHWYPIFPLLVGLALIAVSHVLTPCEDRIAQWRKARSAEQQSPSSPIEPACPGEPRHADDGRHSASSNP
jgi:hypothetical protein